MTLKSLSQYVSRQAEQQSGWVEIATAAAVAVATAVMAATMVVKRFSDGAGFLSSQIEAIYELPIFMQPAVHIAMLFAVAIMLQLSLRHQMAVGKMLARRLAYSILLPAVKIQFLLLCYYSKEFTSEGDDIWWGMSFANLCLCLAQIVWSTPEEE